jgi:ACS family hexuronate transporter-like MFS transporter
MTIQSAGDDSSGRTSHYRWVICALMFFATTINYVDRSVFGLLAPDLKSEFKWTANDYSFIVSVFTFAYAIGYAVAGRMMDRIGVRRGFLWAVGIWSVAAMMHGLVRPFAYLHMPWLQDMLVGTRWEKLYLPALLSVIGFCAARIALGLAEGGNFPGAIKTVGEWHPKKERALSTGIFNSGSNIGILVATCSVPFVIYTMKWSWTTAFYITGALGFLWMAFWWLMYDSPERHPRVSPAELALIRSDPPDPPQKISWLSLLGYRQTWAYVAAMFLVSPIWWFYLYWMPLFLENNHGLNLKQRFVPLMVVYLLADVGSVCGGWLSSWLIKRGTSVNAARKTTFLICALCALPVVTVSRIENMWLAVIVVGIAAAAHAGFSANLYTIVSDTVPRKAVSSVVGLGGPASGIGMILLSTLVGIVLEWTKSTRGKEDYLVPFLIAGSAYLVATALIHVILPRLQPMEFNESDPAATNA